MSNEINFYGKEIQILRQSQQKMAYYYLKDLGIKVTMTELQRTTDLFVECCLRPHKDQDLKERIGKFEKWINEKFETEG